MKKLVLLVLVFVVAGMASASMITGIERRGSSNPAPAIAGSPIAPGAVIFVDRVHVYGAIPVEMTGADYVTVSNADKNVGAYQLDVTVSSAGLLGLIIDNRVGHGNVTGAADMVPDLVAAGMQWVIDMGFVNTGLIIEIDEGANQTIDNWSTLFVKTVLPGTYTLYQQNDVTNPGGRNMYSVAAAVPEPTTLLLLGLGGLALARRRR